ncbi:ABC transporter permease [soil metagenome]
MLKNYIKIAFRNLLKHKGYSVINILGLAVGIAVCVLIFRYISHEMTYDAYHENADQIYRVTLQMAERHIAVTPSVISPALQNNFPEVQSGVRILAAGNFRALVIRYEEKVFEESGFAYADSSLFDVFSYEFIAGDPATALTRPQTMILSRNMAQKLFDDEFPVGKTVATDSGMEYEVTAIIENMPSNSHFQFDVIASMETVKNWGELSDTELKGSQFYTYVVLQEDSSPMLLEQKLNAYISEIFPNDYEYVLHLQPVTDIHLYSNLLAEIRPQGDIRYIWAASAIALLILIIACINYMNLATARSVRRSKEVGIRKVLGSQRNQLIGQFYGESAFLVGLAILFAVFIIELTFPWFNQMTAQTLTTGLDDPFLWILLLAVGMIVTFVAGSYPAIMLSGFTPASVLKGSGGAKGKSGFRKVLVVFQFAISVFLIIGTLVIYQQVDFIQSKELGYKNDNVIALNAPNNIYSHFDSFRSELMHLQGIDNVTMASETPVDVNASWSIDIAGVEKVPNLVIMGLLIHPDFNKTLDIPIIAGRDLRQEDYIAANREDDPEYAYLLNETAVRTFNLKPEQIIGRSAEMSGRHGMIVGVVKDFHFAPLHRQIEPLVMFPEGGFSKLIIGFTSKDIRQTLDQTKSVWESIFPGAPFKFTFLDQEYNALYHQEKQAGYIFTTFSILAIFVACLGLFGLASFMTEQRVKEIGVRKVLGASVSNIVGIFSLDFVKLVLIGFIIAVPITLFLMNRWLQNFAYRIDIHYSVIIAAGLITLFIALLTVSYHACKAASIKPVTTLKSDY